VIIWGIGLIDALELFAGIIIFSDSKAEDKIRCKLFNIDKPSIK
jgi:hypothetical protein